MSRKAKQFGISKQTRRQRKRRRREQGTAEPAAIVHRESAAIVDQLFDRRARQPVHFAPQLQRLLT